MIEIRQPVNLSTDTSKTCYDHIYIAIQVGDNQIHCTIKYQILCDNNHDDADDDDENVDDVNDADDDDDDDVNDDDDHDDDQFDTERLN